MAEEKEKLTKYEIARIIGARALQISSGAPFLIKLEEKDLKELKYNPVEIAKKEFEAGVVPISVTRPLPVVEGYGAPEKSTKAPVKAEE
jgi:DNA-directed RNA polymerase subunit K/omega|tara:strand:+ start:25 stop:291 length:267 start_codon:yes stop_codon:yes gene_type:complete